MNKTKFVTITLLSLLMLSMFSAFVSAYPTEVTTPVTIGPDGTFSGSAQDIGVGYQIEGVAGASGSVTAQIYNANPQTSASIPEGVTLSRFVVITFNINSADFTKANIYITYTDADVANLQAPYTVYKYIASTDSYIEVPSSVDTASKLITVTVTSVSDPLFAIGGSALTSTASPDNSGGFSSMAWVILAISIVVIVMLAVFGVWYFKKRPT